MIIEDVMFISTFLKTYNEFEPYLFLVVSMTLL